MWEPEASSQTSRARRASEYVLDATNVHHLTTTLQTYAREKHYALICDASVFCAFDKHLAANPIESLKRQQLFNLRLFFVELLRLFESYPNVIILPEVKAEFANLMASGLAQVDRKKLQYQALAPARKDQAVECFNALLRTEELLRKLRVKLEERSKALPRTNDPIHAALLEITAAVAETLELKKPEAPTRNDTDERIAARAFHEVIVNHKRIAITTRDEDVRRIVSSVYKLLVSSTVREESARIVTRALQLSNIVVLKYNADKDEYARFFESQTQQEIGDFIFSKFLPEKARVKLVSLVRSRLADVARRLEAEGGADLAAGAPAPELPRGVLDALATVWDRMLWYQEVARAVGVADIHEEIRVQQAMREVAHGLRHDSLAEAMERNLEALARKRVAAHLRELGERSEGTQRELAELAELQRSRKDFDLASADRLKTVASEIADMAREKDFFERALALGLVFLTHEHFRRTEELVERFAANGFDLRDGERLIPATEIADLTGRDYPSVLRVVTENDLIQESGLVRIDFSILMRHFI